MYILSRHKLLSDRPQTIWQPLTQKLSQSGLISISDELVRHFREYTDFLGFESSPPLELGQFFDIFSSKRKTALCVVALELRVGQPTLEIHLVAHEESDLNEMRQCVDSLEIMSDAAEGSLRDAQFCRNLSDLLKIESPNGKLLSDKEISVILPSLYDATVRSALRSAIETWGEQSATLKLLMEIIEPQIGSSEDSEKLRSVIGSKEFFNKTYVIDCTRCGSHTLEFGSKADATRTLNKAVNKRCMICGSDSLDAVEAFKIKPAAAQGIRQGLWLEKLVYDVIQPFSSFIASGRMIETFELDVVALVYSKLVVVECKDTSFGQNDYVNLIAKANELNAEIAGVVTTQPVHENVKRLIERHNEESERDVFVIEDVVESKDISENLRKQIDSIRVSFISQLLHGGGIRGRYPRVPPRTRTR